MRAIITLMLACCVLTACGTSTPGIPLAAPTPTPTRPRTIDLKDKDPCLVPDSFTSQFEPFGVPTRDIEPVLHDPECVYNEEWGAAFIMFETKEGIDVFLAGKYIANVARTAPILGFPAINVTYDSDPGRCDVLVDIASHEYLSASAARDSLTDKSIPAPCPFSREWAQAAMSALVSQH